MSRSNIKKEQDIYYFDFNAAELNLNGERVGKTKASKRKTPIHSMLIKLGFLNYVNQQKSAGETMLFSGLKWDAKNGYWRSKWFDNYLCRCGVKDRIKDKNKLVHQSFRHTIKQACQENNIREDWVNKVIGHSHASGLSYDNHELSIKLLSEQVIEKLDFRIDFSHLMDSRKNPYFSAGSDLTAVFP